jgi:hypothetical protein
MNNGKQTAVEWLVKELNQKIDFIPLEKWDMIRDIIQQAKEMEKKQIEDAELRSKEIIIIKHTEHEGGNK